jgi:hypothetical protein
MFVLITYVVLSDSFATLDDMLDKRFEQMDVDEKMGLALRLRIDIGHAEVGKDFKKGNRHI